MTRRPDETMWPDQIAVGVMVQQRLAEVDTDQLWNYYLPEVAATEEELKAVEAAWTEPIDPKYRAFLAHANGWRGLCGDVMLFGTRQLLGAEPMDRATDLLAATVGADDNITDHGLRAGETVIVGAGEYTTELFLMATADSPTPGAIVWMAGHTVEEYSDFDEFFLAMLDYNRYQISQLEKEHGARQ